MSKSVLMIGLGIDSYRGKISGARKRGGERTQPRNRVLRQSQDYLGDISADNWGGSEGRGPQKKPVHLVTKGGGTGMRKVKRGINHP